MMTKRLLSLFLALLFALSLAACGGATAETRTVYTMDTVMELTVYAKRGSEATAALDAAEGLLYQLDGLLDRHDEKSALSTLNAEGRFEDVALASLLADALDIARATDGAFDPTVAPVMDAWDFTGTPRVPSDAELAELLALVDRKNIALDGGRATLTNGAQLDLGGIAKGYAGERVCALLREMDIESAVIDLGGDVGLLGAKSDGSDWRIAVKDPAEPAQFLGVLTASDCFVVTSGIYERYFEENGVRYHHILDPKTGKSAESGLVSVTVVCENGTWADALSTACFVLGEEESLALRERLAAEKGMSIELIFVTDDGRVRYTGGLRERFTPSEEGKYIYECLA